MMMLKSFFKLRSKYKLNKTNMIGIFEELPLNVFLKDAKGRYKITSHICDNLSNGDKNFTIRGKTDLEVQMDKELGKKFYEEDMEIVRTGEPKKYIQEMLFGSSTFYYEINKKPVFDRKGRVRGIIGVVTDITELILTQKKLELIGQIDTMTDFYNRSYFEKNKESFGKLGCPLGIIMADCNRLKYINDNFGHSAGDAYIKACAENIKNLIPTNSICIRMGGDEFLLLCPEYSNEKCVELIEKLKKNEENYLIEDRLLSVSYGHSMYEEGEKSFNTVLSEADQKMYSEKRMHRHV